MTTPRRAATVLVLRQIADSASADSARIEVLLVRRGQRASFMANAYVFPGGRVDEADSQPTAELTTARCAARELHEEAALRVDNLAELVSFARWITPSAEPKRFDTDFFLWALPPGQVPQVDAQEVFDLRWMTAEAAIAAYTHEGFNLPPPTVSTLEDLAAEIAAARQNLPAGASLLAHLLQRCRRRVPVTLLPRVRASQAGGFEIVMPWDREFLSTPGEGEAASCLALGAEPVPGRISRCALDPPGVWHFTRAD